MELSSGAIAETRYHVAKPRSIEYVVIHRVRQASRESHVSSFSGFQLDRSGARLFAVGIEASSASGTDAEASAALT